MPVVNIRSGKMGLAGLPQIVLEIKKARKIIIGFDKTIRVLTY